MIKESNSLPNFVREKKSKALLNTDDVSLAAYKNQRANLKRFNTLNSEVVEIKNDLEEIKNMLKTLTNGKLNG